MSGQNFFLLKKWAIEILRPYPYELIRHLLAHRRMPNLTNPMTFNDKLGHRKFYDFNPIYPVVADKLQVRDFVAQKWGEDILSAIYYLGDNFTGIPFNELPDSFVMKATHGSGSGFITFVNSKEQYREDMLKAQAQALLSQDYGNLTHEWWYTGFKPRLMIEERLQDASFGIPVDYKFFVFHGQAKFVQVDYARFENHTRTFYDMDWRPQEFSFKYHQGPITARPKLLPEMVKVAECLGEEFDFVRVDLYCVNDERIVFGELTLSPEAGWGRFRPAKWDKIMGKLW